MVAAKRIIVGICAVVAVLLSNSIYAQCPQYRETAQAPENVYWQNNPLESNRHNLSAGKKLFKGKGGKTDCVKCHGKKGEGDGPLAKSFAPPPRNLACAPMMSELPDGQLFWIIREGSMDSAMPAHPQLSEAEIWQLVMAIRELSQ